MIMNCIIFNLNSTSEQLAGIFNRKACDSFYQLLSRFAVAVVQFSEIRPESSFSMCVKCTKTHKHTIWISVAAYTYYSSLQSSLAIQTNKEKIVWLARLTPVLANESIKRLEIVLKMHFAAGIQDFEPECAAFKDWACAYAVIVKTQSQKCLK